MYKLIFALACVAHAAAAQAAEPSPLVDFRSKESIARLNRSTDKVDFFHLVNQFEAQENRADCGPTTAVIVLNTLRDENPQIEKPRDPSAFPSEYARLLPPGMNPVSARYTQRAFFDDKMAKVKTREEFYGKPKSAGAKPDPGLQLRQLDGILKENGLDVQLRVADEKLSDETIRKELIENLKNENDYVIVNYFRPALGQKGGGHISPLGAYDSESDSFLILDVNATEHPWVWAPAKALIAAMRAKDTIESRGYLLVREGIKGGK